MDNMRRLVDSGCQIRNHPEHGQVWMEKRNPGVYFRPPRPTGPLTYVDDDVAEAVGFPVKQYRLEAERIKRRAAANARIDQELRFEEIRMEHEQAPRFRAESGSGGWCVVDRDGAVQSEGKLSKAQAEELADLSNREALERDLIAAGYQAPARADATGTSKKDDASNAAA